MKIALSLFIMTVMIVMGIYATGIEEPQEADVLPEIAFLADDVLDMVTGTNFEFKIYDLESETVVTEDSIYESENDRFSEFLKAVTDHQERYDLYLSDLRIELVTESRYDDIPQDDIGFIDIGNTHTAGLILRL